MNRLKTSEEKTLHTLQRKAYGQKEREKELKKYIKVSKRIKITEEDSSQEFPFPCHQRMKEKNDQLPPQCLLITLSLPTYALWTTIYILRKPYSSIMLRQIHLTNANSLFFLS
jgi:hypothetical protein